MLSLRSVSVVLALGLAMTACGSKDDDKAKTSTSADKTDKGKRALTAEAFYKDWTTTKGAQLMKKYGDKPVTVTGTVFHVIQGGEFGQYTMFISAGKHKLMAKFSDKGKAANAKKIAKGSRVTVTCTPSGMIGRNISLNGCGLQ